MGGSPFVGPGVGIGAGAGCGFGVGWGFGGGPLGFAGLGVGGGCGVGIGLGWGYGAAVGSKYIVVSPEFKSHHSSSAAGGNGMLARTPAWLTQLRDAVTNLKLDSALSGGAGRKG